MLGALPPKLYVPAIILVLLVAAGFRFHALNWDQRIGAHPDERYIVSTAAQLSFPGALDPFEVAPRFAYGHFVLYLLALGHMLAPNVDPLLVGRMLSAAADLGTVALTYALGRRTYGEPAGLLAAAFVALMVAHVQQAHFYTADVLLAFLVMGSLFFAVRFAEDGRAMHAWLAGAAAGLALGTKMAAGMLLIPLAVALYPDTGDRLGPAWRCGLAAIVTFLLVSPFAALEFPTFVSNLREQAAIVRGAADVPYTRQYHDTLPYVYPVLQQFRWGTGWLLGLCAWGGLVAALGGGVLVGFRRRSSVLLLWVVSFFALVGGLYAKFPRYLLPILPIQAILAAHLITGLGRRRRELSVIFAALVLGSLLARSLALASMYGEEHPWISASSWFYEHAEPGTTVAVEAWDHPLPLDAQGYHQRKLPIFEEETPQKWETIEEALAHADYVILASRRGYAALGRWPARYWRTMEFYRELLKGYLGFEPIACFSRHPRLGTLVLRDDPTEGFGFSLPQACRPEACTVLWSRRLDESFVVYDHPRVIVLKATR